MMAFNVCVNDTVQLLNISNGKLFVMSFDRSCNSHHCCDDCCLSVYNGAKQRYQFIKRLV